MPDQVQRHLLLLSNSEAEIYSPLKTFNPETVVNASITVEKVSRIDKMIPPELSE